MFDITRGYTSHNISHIMSYHIPQNQDFRSFHPDVLSPTLEIRVKTWRKLAGKCWVLILQDGFLQFSVMGKHWHPWLQSGGVCSRIGLKKNHYFFFEAPGSLAFWHVISCQFISPIFARESTVYLGKCHSWFDEKIIRFRSAKDMQIWGWVNTYYV